MLIIIELMVYQATKIMLFGQKRKKVGNKFHYVGENV